MNPTHPFCLYSFILDHSISVHPAPSGNLDCFQFLALTNKATLTTFIHGLWWHKHSFLWGTYLGVELLGYIQGRYIFSFSFPKVVIQLPAAVREFQLFHIHTNRWWCLFGSCWPFWRGVMIHYCAYNLHMFIGHMDSFFVKYLFFS